MDTELVPPTENPLGGGFVLTDTPPPESVNPPLGVSEVRVTGDGEPPTRIDA